MAGVNISKVHLLSVPLENDYKNTLYFSTLENQQTYFLSKVKHTFTEFSYQRKDFIIRVPEHIDHLYDANYVMYQNPYYSNKWFYCFITDMKYINDGTTEIHIETDVMQTWLLDFEVKASFVEREHVNDDTQGLHTLPENLETGEFIVNAHNQANYGGDNSSLVASNKLNIVVGVTTAADGTDFKGSLYNGIYSGIQYYSFPCTMDGVELVRNFINAYDKDARSTSIVCMFLAPSSLAPLRDGNTIAGSNTIDSYYINPESIGEVSDFSKIINFSNKVDNFVPKNNKTLCFPFRYLLVSNNSGGDVVYKYEDFYKGESKQVVTPSFKIEGCLTPGCSVRMIPKNYKGVERNDSEGINLGKYPCLNWTSDVFTNWLTQNGVNIGLSLISGGLQIAGGIGLMGTGAGSIAGSGSVASGSLTIAQSLGQIYQQSLVPPQSEGNINCGDVVSASNTNDFHFYEMSVKKEVAMIVDSYFTMFGYKTNQVKVPNKNHRQYYWYTKTIDVNIDGEIPMNDMSKIKSCYNNGITFWRAGSDVGNYEQDNVIINY